MPKTRMICPFSGELCRECPQYRGRHYYLCFKRKYRGYLADSEKANTKDLHHSGTNDTQNLTDSFRLPIPPPLKPSPTWLAFNDYPGRKDR